MALLHVRVIEAKDLVAADTNGKSDPYVRLKISDEKLKTTTQDKTLNPIWGQDFTIALGDSKDRGELKVEVYDADLVRSDFIGRINVPLNFRGSQSRWYYLMDSKHENRLQGAISLALAIEENPPSTATTGIEVSKRRAPLLDQAIKQRAMREEKEEPSLRSKIFCGTWNVGNKEPPSAADLKAFIQPGYDIYAIGTQECLYPERKGYPNCDTDFTSTLQACLGTDYQLVKSCNLMQIRLAVFARNSIVPFLDKAESSTEATGIGGVVGNKGGIAVGLRIYDKRVCFVNSHLAAHQGKMADRHANVDEIFRGLKFGGEFPILDTFHHVFWMGDLNYRLNFGTQGDDDSPSKAQHDEMVGLISQNKLAPLLATDQLAFEMKTKKIFIGFEEGKINFRPTFKVLRNEVTPVYDDKRSPAWCDRVLWHSLAGFSGDVRHTGYRSVEAITTSDHKPVYATFNLDSFWLPPALDATLPDCHIKITNLRASGIPVGDIGGKSDPFIKFSGPFVAKTVKTPTRKKTLEPEWGDDTPAIRLIVNNKARIAKSVLLVRLYDADLTSSQLLACGNIPLVHAARGAPVPFELDLHTRGGQPAGTLKGALQVEDRR